MRSHWPTLMAEVSATCRQNGGSAGLLLAAPSHYIHDSAQVCKWVPVHMHWQQQMHSHATLLPTCTRRLPCVTSAVMGVMRLTTSLLPPLRPLMLQHSRHVCSQATVCNTYRQGSDA